MSNYDKLNMQSLNMDELAKCIATRDLANWFYPVEIEDMTTDEQYVCIYIFNDGLMAHMKAFKRTIVFIDNVITVIKQKDWILNNNFYTMYHDFKEFVEEYDKRKKLRPQSCVDRRDRLIKRLEDVFAYLDTYNGK